MEYSVERNRKYSWNFSLYQILTKQINYNHLRERNYLCSLFNTIKNETVLHFVARCPILIDLGTFLFGKKFDLKNFMSEARKCRWDLILEFNYQTLSFKVYFSYARVCICITYHHSLFIIKMNFNN